MATTQAQTKVSERTQAGAAWRRFWLLVGANLLMVVRSKDYAFWIVAFPILLMLLFGAIWGNRSELPDGFDYVAFLTPGLIVLSLMNNGIPGRAETMAIYRERGILRRIQATPLPVWQLQATEVALQSVLLLGQTFLLVGVSMLVFNAKYDTWGLLSALPAVLLGALVFISMGQAVAAVVRKVRTANVVAMALLTPLMFLGGLWTPISEFPSWLQGVSKLLPSTMVSEMIRVPMLGETGYVPVMPLWACLLGVLVWGALSVAVSVRYFKWS